MSDLAITAGPVLGLAQLAAVAVLGRDPGTVRLFPLDPPDDMQPPALVTLPGWTQGIRIRREKDIEGVPLEGRAGTVKLYHGMKEADIELSIRLDDDRLSLPGGGGLSLDIPVLGGASPVEKLKLLEQLFSRRALGGGLMTWQITQAAINAHGVKRVVLSRLESAAGRASDWLDVSLGLAQHEPDADAAEQRELAAPAVDAPPGRAENPLPAETSALDEAASWYEPYR